MPVPELMGEPPGRIAPVAELVNAGEFEQMAKRRIGSAEFAEIADGAHPPFARITFRPRMMVNTTGLDLTAKLFGRQMYAPILIGPLAQQKRFHPEGELAMARGASGSKTVMVVAANTSFPLAQIAAQTTVDFWYQIDAEGEVNASRERALAAIEAGCKALCLTLRAWDQSAIDRFRNGLKAPVLLKGMLGAQEAKACADRGVHGVILSGYVRGSGEPLAQPMDVLPAVAEAVGGKIPILIDGGFRRGAHILMALALGARAVLIGRPALWGLAAYGAAGVERVTGMLQTELARSMAMCGRPNLEAIDRSAVRLHRV